MKLEQIVYTASVRVKFTKQEIGVLMKLSAMHYDGVCQAAGRCGGFLWGIRNGNDSLTCREADILGKICEGASFWERSPLQSDQVRGRIGRKLFGETLRLMQVMSDAKAAASGLAREFEERYQMETGTAKPYTGPLPYQGETHGNR